MHRNLLDMYIYVYLCTWDPIAPAPAPALTQYLLVDKISNTSRCFCYCTSTIVLLLQFPTHYSTLTTVRVQVARSLFLSLPFPSLLIISPAILLLTYPYVYSIYAYHPTSLVLHHNNSLVHSSFQHIIFQPHSTNKVISPSLLWYISSSVSLINPSPNLSILSKANSIRYHPSGCQYVRQPPASKCPRLPASMRTSKAFAVEIDQSRCSRDKSSVA